jgi:hypothetical protein
MTTVVRARSGGRPVLVVRPDASSPGSISVDLLSTANRARSERAAMCVLPLPATAGALRDLILEDVPLLPPGAWLRARWGSADAIRRGSVRLARARAGVWHEWHKEIRRHAGDERLPPPLRARLREHARQVARRPATDRSIAIERQWLRDPVRISLPPAAVAEASRIAAAAGVVAGRVAVTVDVRARPELFAPAAGVLVDRGYQVIQIGPAGERIPHPDVVDGRSGYMTTASSIHLLLASRFLVSDTPDTQRIAYLTGTPTLLLNATDPWSACPIRPDGLFTLATPVDLETGDALDPGALLQEWRGRRALGWRGNTAGQIVEAVREMHDASAGAVHEHPSQRRFRMRLLETSGEEGFVAGGRLARWQAERVNTAR